MLLLDSSVILEVINDTQKSKEIVSKLGSKDLFMTPFSIYEVFLGLKQKELSLLITLLYAIKVLNYDVNSALSSARIMENLTKI